ncbi:MAG: hypothetical protein AAGU21_01110 [Solidesulfovibrio sp.]|uniref:hypothetical protein n=1 Tax=Solidesulfovibrio sp. TaxID=2910990 RepID=UPI002B1F3C07|nr:hypothetical protein [Solidesulfovibrio sp.]MEA4857920.1 hypothetical protein [Solidesulfovibrio sp.]
MSLSDRIEYRTYKITLVEPILGSLPSQRQVYQDLVAARAPEPDVEGAEEMAMLPTLPEGMDERTTVFLRNNDGWCSILDYQFFGFLKEAGNTLKDIVQYETTGKRAKSTKEGIAALRNKLGRYAFCGPRIIPLQKEPNGIFKRPLRRITKDGPMSCLATSELINAGVAFDVWIGLLPHGEVQWSVIEQCLEYGQMKGLGQFRGGGFGRFTFDLVSQSAM